MQIQDCVYIATGGERGLSGGAAWMRNFMELYDTDQEAFQLILREAEERMNVQDEKAPPCSFEIDTSIHGGKIQVSYKIHIHQVVVEKES
jgi:hypothetical protein